MQLPDSQQLRRAALPLALGVVFGLATLGLLLTLTFVIPDNVPIFLVVLLLGAAVVLAGVIRRDWFDHIWWFGIGIIAAPLVFGIVAVTVLLLTGGAN